MWWADDAWLLLKVEDLFNIDGVLIVGELLAVVERDGILVGGEVVGIFNGD